MSFPEKKILTDAKAEDTWNMSETHLRSIMKAVSYRCVGSLATGIIGGLLTGSTMMALGIGIADFVVKIILFYTHERIWHKIKWGISKSSNVDIGGGI